MLGLSLQYISHLDDFIFIFFKLTVFTLHLFMVTSQLQCTYFVTYATSGLKCIHFNFLNVKCVYI